MRLVEAISLLRNSIKQYQDDSSYTDEFLWNVIKIFRNKYQSERIKENFRISDRLSSTYCIPLEIANSHDCDCVSVGCKVHKTVFKIPQTFFGKSRDQIRVFTLDRTEIFQVTPQEQKSNQLVDIKKDVITYSFLNRKIVLWNTDTTNLIPAILVDGVWEDETDFEGITYCEYVNNPSLDVSENCFDLESIEIALEGDFMSYVIQESMQHLGFSAQFREDITNNRNNEI
jgi:hypothetical protein